MTKHLDITKKHDAILLFDCTDGNPNGDPDAGNQPRIDPETQQGLVTDACIKRKVRNYIELRSRAMTEEQREIYKIFIEEGTVLNDAIARGYKDLNYELKAGTPEQQQAVSKWMQANFYDIRTFGAVLTTGLKAGQVWGPVQVSHARSYDRVLPQSFTITRQAVTEAKEGKENKTMGRKELIPYGLYKSYVFYNPHLRGEHFTSQDLELFWEALRKGWEFDRSASRGFMAVRGLWIFSHENQYGNCPTHQLFDSLGVTLKPEVDVPRHFNDYAIAQPESLPDGITLTQL
jgi:CRISPR-associated protein Csd2